MGDIIDLALFRDPAGMSREELLTYLESLRNQIAELDASEPADMESEEYEAWGEKHEDLEDLVDEALDLLDEMN